MRKETALAWSTKLFIQLVLIKSTSLITDVLYPLVILRKKGRLICGVFGMNYSIFNARYICQHYCQLYASFVDANMICCKIPCWWCPWSSNCTDACSTLLYITQHSSCAKLRDFTNGLLSLSGITAWLLLIVKWISQLAERCVTFFWACASIPTLQTLYWLLSGYTSPLISYLLPYEDSYTTTKYF